MTVLKSNLNVDTETGINIYRTMARISACDKRIQQLLSAGVMQFQYYPCGGQEAIPATICQLLNPDDFMVTTYRGLHDILSKGTSMQEIIGEMAGRITGTSKGKGGAMHLSDPLSGLMVTTGIVGGGLPIANGLGLAAKMKKTGKVVVCSFGEGAANIGAFGESINMAALWDLPVIFLCQNNAYAEYTSFEDSTKSKSIASRVASYGMPGITLDGTNPAELYKAASEAIERARRGDGPTLLECNAPRLQGHSFGSEEGHMDQDALAKARENAPLITFRRHLINTGAANEEILSKIEEQAANEVEAAVEAALAAHMPGKEELYTDVFEDPSAIPFLTNGTIQEEPDLSERKTTTMMCAQAINDALDISLENDPDVFLLGEDITDPAGGVMKITVGLSSKHGTERVRPTPISEQAIIGAAIGAALDGMKPVPEIMISDFALVCMDQIANHAAKLRYMSGGRINVPITIRMPSAGFMGNFAAQHSQSLEALFTHIPGLKVIAPSNARDAKGLLLSCIADPDPCIFIEYARILFTAGEVPEGHYKIPLGKASVPRGGKDISIITYGWTVVEAKAAAEELHSEGIDAEIIDLRSLVPLDFDTVRKSVAKTGRGLIVHSAVEFCGFGAELAARLQEDLFGQLKAPIRRLGARYTPIPFTVSLENLHFPNKDRICDEVRRLIG